ncbi:unnamed protein product, partial [Linum tenue]
ESREEELSLLCFFEGSRGDPLLSSEKKSPSPFLSPSHEEEEPASVHEGNGRNLPNDDRRPNGHQWQDFSGCGIPEQELMPKPRKEKLTMVILS